MLLGSFRVGLGWLRSCREETVQWVFVAKGDLIQLHVSLFGDQLVYVGM